MITGRKRIPLEACAVVKGQIARHLPLITRVDAPAGHSHGRRIDILEILAHGLWQPKQEVGPAIVERRGRTTVERRQATAEIEAATRAIGGLRLEVVDRVVGVLATKPEVMRATAPAEVAGGDILVITEEERIGDVRIADRRETADREARITALQAI